MSLHGQLSLNPPDFATGKGPVWIDAADFNRDGLPDIVTANSSDNSVSVLLNNGDGTFGQHHDFAAGRKPSAVITSDFNHDGIGDVAVANFDDSTILIYLGNGDGTLRAVATLLTPPSPTALMTADFNRDGKVDLAVVNKSGSLSIFLGNGSGAFLHSADYPTGTTPTSVTTADFNGDGIPDLAVGNNIGNTISVFLGVGDGTFRANGLLTTSDTHPMSLAAADFDGDGKADIAVWTDHPDRSTSYFVYMFSGDGRGSFAQPRIFSAPQNFTQMIAADLNRDGRPDLVFGGGGVQGLGGLSVMFNSGNGNFSFAYQLPTGASASSVVAADFNHDGIVDCVTANSGEDTISFFAGTSDGRLQPRQRFPESLGETVLTADFNQDGIPDLLVTGETRAAFSVLLGSGDGTFRNASDTLTSTATNGFAIYSIAVGDINGDNVPDVVVSALDRLLLWYGIGNGAFSSPRELPRTLLPGEPNGASTVAIGDFNNDGFPDLITVHNRNDSDKLEVFLGNRDGSYVEKDTVLRIHGTEFILGDFNNDGKLDVALNQTHWFFTTDSSPYPVLVMLGNGDGTFHEAPNSISSNGSINRLYAADFDHDGKLDLVVSSGGLHVFKGLGDGSFQQAGTVNNPVGFAIASADLNGDGNLDIISANNAGRLVISLGNGDLTFQPQLEFAVGGAGSPVVADFNLDGKPDIATTTNSFPSYVSITLNTSNGNFAGARDFQFTLNPSVLTVKAGQSASTIVSITRSGGFNDGINLSCSGLPTGAACTFGSSNGSNTLKITTTAPGTAALMPLGGGEFFAFLLPVFGFVLATREGNCRRRNRCRMLVVVALVAASLLLLQACGGGDHNLSSGGAQPGPVSNTPPPGGSGGGTGTGGGTGGSGGTGTGGTGGSGGSGATAPGTYTINVTGTSNTTPAISHSQKLTLIVQ